MTRGRAAAVGIGLASVLATGGCEKARTTVLLSVANEDGVPVPDEVRLNVYDQSERRFPETRLPAQGALVPAKLPLLGTLVIYVDDATTKVRLEAHGLAGGSGVSQGIAQTAISTRKQIAVTLTLRAGKLADADLDLVPDEIDNCPQVVNFDQADRNADGVGNACQLGGGMGELGTPCASGSDCRSSFCAQGACCITPCEGVCQTCADKATPGVCVNVPDGQDPSEQCPDTPRDGCKQDGFCDGRGACRPFHRAGTVCTSPTCGTPAALTTAGTCDGAGNCTPGKTIVCEPYVCSDGACKGACAADADCMAPRLCRQGSCGRSPNGAACTDGTTCNSLLCVDGVCCATDCTATCFSCNVAGSAGACTAIPDGMDAPADCPAEAASSCGRNGKCQAGGTCAKYPDGAVCVAAACANSSQTSARTCDGAGVCRDATVTACGVFACTGLVCATVCAADADCASGYYCAAPTCVPKLATGTDCATANQCVSGFCADGVCCGTACAGPCKSCKAPTPGTCVNYAAGGDPDADCAQGLACNGAGACFPNCTNDAPDCEPGFYCTAAVAGACAAKKALAGPCAAAKECTSTFCTDGVCCAEACTETCKSCNLAPTPGQCTFVANGNRDPGGVNACSAPNRCNGAGVCQ